MSRRPVDPVVYLQEAAEAIRKYNHATYATTHNPHPLPYPGEAYRAIAAFKALAERLPQAFEHTGNALDSLADTGHVMATHGDVDHHVSAAINALTDAEDLARSLTTALERAHSATGVLGYTDLDTESE
ncbi:hypothetical protein [Streptomyces longispororuber]|uniref:hypothetical protein n=1 Tax=Streptomyces longispororuber TaxID=68230 RepID=UPI00210E4631|nr:hypothetical protein [Streptomyces longispororuber]MCQ4212371.1 hypothetical protein [Streptomyces longispororuber]